MRVLALDPGYDRLGVAVMERRAGKDYLIYSTCLSSTRGSDLSTRLGELGTGLELIFSTHLPTHVAVETLFFNKNVKTAIAVAQARGMILYLAKRHHCVVCEYSPQAIKVAITNYGNSDKTAVIAMAKRLVKNAPEHAHDDEYDAIAVGVTCLAYGQPGR